MWTFGLNNSRTAGIPSIFMADLLMAFVQVSLVVHLEDGFACFHHAYTFSEISAIILLLAHIRVSRVRELRTPARPEPASYDPARIWTYDKFVSVRRVASDTEFSHIYALTTV